MHVVIVRMKICFWVMQEDVKDVQREVQVLKLVGKHNNVAELIDTFEDSAYVHLIGSVKLDHVTL